jgi:hypothetical protein
MNSRVLVRCIPGVLGTVATLLVARPATAQTHDEARLTVGVALGYIGGSSLWSVDNQPIFDIAGDTARLNLHRRLGANLTLSAQGAYYASPHWGYTAEFTYVGLGTEDNCELASTENSPPSPEACAALNGTNRPASAVSLMGGVVWRPWSRSAYQPYLRGIAGAAVVPRSTLQMASTFGPELENRLEIYIEDNSHMVRPSATFGAGISTAPNAGYQLTLEARGTAAIIPVVTGPTLHQIMRPPSESRVKIFPSFLVGLNIVLEKRRGRRY